VETLTNYLKSSSALDWLTILAVITVVLLCLILLIAARNRGSMYVLMAIAVIPFLLGLLTTYGKNREIERVNSTVESVPVEAVEAARREAMISTYIGGLGTIVSISMGIIGLAVKNR
jgi:hypothetical protein